MRNIFLKMAILTIAISASVSGAVGVMSAKSRSAEAAESSCQVTVVDGPSNRGIKLLGDTVFSTIDVTGTNENCDAYATLAVWKLPNASGLPLSAQEFYGYKTKKLTVGRNIVATKVPDCYWQADLLGQKRPKSIHGDANYDAGGRDVLVNYRLGGDKTCTPTPTPDPTPTPEPPVTPPVAPAAVVTGTAIPDTGAGTIALIAGGLTSVGTGAAHFVFRRRRM